MEDAADARPDRGEAVRLEDQEADDEQAEDDLLHRQEQAGDAREASCELACATRRSTSGTKVMNKRAEHAAEHGAEAADDHRGQVEHRRASARSIPA